MAAQSHQQQLAKLRKDVKLLTERMDVVRRDNAYHYKLIDSVDHWSQGAFSVTIDLLVVLVSRAPDTIQALRKKWRDIPDLYQRADNGEDVGYPAELLQPVSTICSILDKAAEAEKAAKPEDGNEG